MLQTKTVEVNLDGCKLSLYIPADPEALIGDITDPDQTPCWAEVWPAAIGLAHFLWHGPDMQDCLVLELGAGLGLPGLTAGLKGAAVTFSDFQPLALEFCRRNAARHNLRHCRFLLADWRDYACPERFDLVLASDIAYEPRLLPHLKKVLLHAIKPGGLLFVSHPGRPVTRHFVEELRLGASFVEERAVVPVTVDDPLRPRYRITVHRLKKPVSRPRQEK